MAAATVILLSGTSSSGKSTLARGLQQKIGRSFLHLQLDAFIEMMPDPKDPVMFEKMIRGMGRAIAGLAAEGNDLIVDHVVIDEAWLQQLVELLGNYTVYFVGVDCSLDELERREKTRDMRRQGFARQQSAQIHQGKIYDLVVNTEVLDRDECVNRVIQFYENVRPTAFARMREEHAVHTA
jgi:chloramphenicol 3-O phosphotransferase